AFPRRLIGTRLPCTGTRTASINPMLTVPDRMPCSCSAKCSTALSILGFSFMPMLRPCWIDPNPRTIGRVRLIIGAGPVPEEEAGMSTLQRLTDRGLVRPPRWLPNAVQYETIMGSVAYGVSSDTSDLDLYGWAIPPKDDVFPHLRGEIPGFGSPRPQFQQFQEHHVHDPDAMGGRGRTFDLTTYGIVKFFNLAMQNNPNIIDSLFTPVNCVAHSTRVGDMVRENRKLFLHRGAWSKFKNYAYSQLHKLSTK